MKLDLVVAGYIIHKNRVLLIQHKKLDLWLPVGGHIEKDETPDDALFREIKEEVGIDVEILNCLNFPIQGNTKKNLANPFHVNVHSVKDHDHCCLYYICKAINPEKLKINSELKSYRWFSKEDLNKEDLPSDVRNQCLKVFELFDNLSKFSNL